MKAVSHLLGAASAIALSAAIAVPGAFLVQFASVTVAEAAVVSRIDVRGNQRVEADTIRRQTGITPGQSFTNADIDEAVIRRPVSERMIDAFYRVGFFAVLAFMGFVFWNDLFGC